jgi:hypothetical protein
MDDTLCRDFSISCTALPYCYDSSSISTIPDSKEIIRFLMINIFGSQMLRVEVMLCACIREVLSVRILAGLPDVLIEIFCYLP